MATGTVVAAPKAVADNVDKFWDPAWKDYGSVDGTFYAAPSGASVKSLVWYSPKQFEDNGWEVPTTLDELQKLSDDDRRRPAIKPWCAGIASGDATGWPITDWMEDMMLRVASPEVFDKWVSHEIAFNSADPTKALDAVGDYLKNPKYVNGGFGDVTSIASTAFQDGGLPILDGQCALHRQASFYAANWPEGTKVAEDGDVFAFYLPGVKADDHPVLGAGEFVTAFSDRPEVQALQTFWSTDTWANIKAKASSEDTGGGWITANKGLDTANLVNPIDLLSAKILQDPNAVFRFDGSDQMPAAADSRVLEGSDQLDHRAVDRRHARQDRGRLADVLTLRPVPGSRPRLPGTGLHSDSAVVRRRPPLSVVVPVRRSDAARRQARQRWCSRCSRSPS